MEPIIEIKNIGKCYNITGRRHGYVALRDIITENLKHPIETLFRIGKKIIGTDRRETFWALRDVNLSVNRGEAIGIIGANGAGKSTLLKILSRITPPTEGEITLRGRVASLLEVGTGFHPELSGRENIFLNGAILGMKKKEIASKLDKIIEFSGIEQFIDTPVKHYSSGMYVRLAFSVAAHLEPDILFIDEVLAVGDAEFQRKCLGKMDEVTKTEGRTILFVSHNMDAISRLCTKTIFLDHGKIIAAGNTDEVIGKYLSGRYDTIVKLRFPLIDSDLTVHDYSIRQNGAEVLDASGNEPIEIGVDFSVGKKLRAFRVGVFVKNNMGTVITKTFIQDYAPALEEIEAGRYKAYLQIPARLVMPGQYRIELKLFCYGVKSFFGQEHIEKSLTIHAPKEFNEVQSKNNETRGYFFIPAEWQIKKF